MPHSILCEISAISICRQLNLHIVCFVLTYEEVHLVIFSMVFSAWQNVQAPIKLLLFTETCQHSITSQKEPACMPLQYKCIIYLSLLHISPVFSDSSSNLNLSNHSIPGHQACRATKPVIRCYLRCLPGFTGEKFYSPLPLPGIKPGLPE